MVLLFLDLYGDSRTARCSGVESSGTWRGGGGCEGKKVFKLFLTQLKNSHYVINRRMITIDEIM